MMKVKHKTLFLFFVFMMFSGLCCANSINHSETTSINNDKIISPIYNVLNGVVAHILVKENDMVKEGDPILLIYLNKEKIISARANKNGIIRKVYVVENIQIKSMEKVADIEFVEKNH